MGELVEDHDCPVHGPKLPLHHHLLLIHLQRDGGLFVNMYVFLSIIILSFYKVNFFIYFIFLLLICCSLYIIFNIFYLICF